MILDATAGNQTMWAKKHVDNIIYIDRELELERRPTIFADNTNTPFLDNTFDSIFYDPPHSVAKRGHYHTYPRRSKEYIEKWHDNAIPRYYGWDKYANISQLMRHVHLAGVEFRRILKPDGLLWLKWNEMRLPLFRVMSALSSWSTLMRLYIKSPSQTAGKHQTFWLALQYTEQSMVQSVL